MAVRWSSRAEHSFARQINWYLDNNRDGKANHLMRRTAAVISNLMKYPEMYPIDVDRPDTRRAVLTDDVVLYYTVSDREVILVAFWGARQDPTNLDL